LIVVGGIQTSRHPLLTVNCGCDISQVQLVSTVIGPEARLIVSTSLEVLVMSSPDPTHLRDELVQLFDLQLRVLEKRVFGVVTKSELREYDRRHDRICALYNQLANEKPSPLFNDSRMD
jgi:hypothetical protein